MPIDTSGVTPDAGSSATTATQPAGNPEGGRRPSTREEFHAATLASLRGETREPLKTTPSEPTGVSSESSDAPEGTETPDVLSHVSDAADQGANPDDAEDSDEGSEAEAESAEPESGDQRWPKSAVDRVQRRTKQRDDARRELEAVKAQLAEFQAKAEAPKTGTTQVAPDDDGPLRDLRDPSKITERYQAAQTNIGIANDLLDEIHDNPDAVADRLRKVGIELEEYTPAAMRAYLRAARATEQKVVQEAPRRIEFMRNEQHAQQEALKIMPELADPKSERYQAVQTVVKEYPDLKKRADWAWHAAIYAMGHEVLKAKTKGSATSTAPAATPAKPKLPAPPRVPGAGSAQPAKATGDQARLDALRQKAFGPGGTREDRQAYTEAQLRGGA